LEIPLAGSEESVVLAQIDFDPISRTRYVAVDALQGELRRLFALGTQYAVSLSSTHGDNSLRVLLSNVTGPGPCPDVTPRDSAGSSLVTVWMEGRAVTGGKPGRILFAPRLQMRAGELFKTLSGYPDPGEQRGFVVAGYVARDGRAVAVLFKARANWTDASDGREYYFTQSFVDPESRFVPLTRDGVVAARLSPGVATAEPVELRVYGEE
jgi:hypothetical protein